MTFRHLANMMSGYGRPDSPGAAWAYNDYAIQLYQRTVFDRVFQEVPNVRRCIRAGGNCAVMIPSRNLVLVSTKGKWGKLAAGDAAAPMNQIDE